MPRNLTGAAKPGYSHFWKLRGTSCFWISEHVGYRIGALLAVPANRLGLGPNSISVLSAIIGVGGTALVAYGPFSRTSGAVLLGIFLLVANGLDCTDGLIARQSRRGSSFGALLDKLIDMISIIWVPGLLGASAMEKPEWILPPGWQPLALMFIVGVRPVYSTVSWLKDSQRYGMSRETKQVVPGGLGWRMRRLVGNIMDDVPWRIGTAASWGGGFFWEFSLAYSLASFLIFIPYLFRTKNDLCALDLMKQVPKDD